MSCKSADCAKTSHVGKWYVTVPERRTIGLSASPSIDIETRSVLPNTEGFLLIYFVVCSGRTASLK